MQVADGYRPPMLSTVPDSVKDVITACWKGHADLRPTANEVVVMLEGIEASGENVGSTRKATACDALPQQAGGGVAGVWLSARLAAELQARQSTCQLAARVKVVGVPASIADL